MAHEVITQVKRTIYVAECPKCHERKEHTEKTTKEWFCQPCSEWVPFVEVSYTGPSISNKDRG